MNLNVRSPHEYLWALPCCFTTAFNRAGSGLRRAGGALIRKSSIPAARANCETLVIPW